MKVIRATALGGLLLLAASAPAGAALAATGPATGSAATATAVTAAAGAKTAGAGPIGTEPGSRLVLSVTTDSTNATTAVELTCDPDGGNHPRPAEACALLRTVAGDPATLKPSPDAQCIMIFDPVTARVSGHWEGHVVSYEETFGNACLLESATGPIFTFRDAPNIP